MFRHCCKIVGVDIRVWTSDVSESLKCEYSNLCRSLFRVLDVKARSECAVLLSLQQQQQPTIRMASRRPVIYLMFLGQSYSPNMFQEH